MILDIEAISVEVREELARKYPRRDRAGIEHGQSVLNEGYNDTDGVLFLERGEGIYVYDSRGRPYLDFALGAGTHILGHAPAKVVEAVRRRVGEGTLFVRPNTDAHHYAELLSTLQPSSKRFAFCNSGAEATMRAARTARAHSGKPRVALWPGAWHGSHDWGLFEEDPESAANYPTFRARSAGLPATLTHDLLLLPPSSDAAVEIIAEHAKDLAMVMVEPIRGPLPRPDSADVLPALREACTRHSVLLGFDEVVTGFRLALGGGQERYGVEADIVAYGKIAGGGLPVGIVGIKDEIAQTISANANAPSDIVYFGGTFSANPLSMVAGQAAITELMGRATEIYPRLDRLTEGFIVRMNAHFQEMGVSIHCIGLSGIFRFIFTDRSVATRRERDVAEVGQPVQDLFYDLLLLDGIHVGTNRIMFLSASHDESHLDCLFDAAVRAAKAIWKTGMQSG